MTTREPLRTANLDVVAERPILVIADQPMDAEGGGAVIFRSLLGEAFGKGVCWASPYHEVDVPTAGRYALTSKMLALKPVLSVLRRRTLRRQIIGLARRINAAAYWIVMHGSSVHIAADLLRHQQLPIHLTVHDDPVYAMGLRSRRRLPFLPWIARDFGYAIRHASSIDVISTKMAERYRRLYQVHSVVLHRALGARPASAPRYNLAIQGLTLGILGNTYAYGQLPLVAEALIEAGHRLGTPTKIVFCGRGYGERLRQEFAGRLEVEVLGHLPEPAAIEQLGRCGLLYLNYPFSTWSRVLRETSFPTKLSSYLAAARPLLVHSPQGSTIEDLTQNQDFSCFWPSQNPEDCARRIVEFVRREGFAESVHDHAEQFRKKYYDADAHRRTVNKILNQLSGNRSVHGKSNDSGVPS